MGHLAGKTAARFSSKRRRLNPGYFNLTAALDREFAQMKAEREQREFMAHNVVTSERVWNEVRELVAPRVPSVIGSRGNYPKNAYRVYFEGLPASQYQMVTISPKPRKKHPRQV